MSHGKRNLVDNRRAQLENRNVWQTHQQPQQVKHQQEEVPQLQKQPWA
jgi:hypothetical protein